jgi:vacuolar-type H+-ATPase subunit C/Vma6
MFTMDDELTRALKSIPGELFEAVDDLADSYDYDDVDAVVETIQEEYEEREETCWPVERIEEAWEVIKTWKTAAEACDKLKSVLARRERDGSNGAASLATKGGSE